MTAKTLAILLLVASVVMTVGSLFVFSIGWDKLKDALDMSKVSGHLEAGNTTTLRPNPRLILQSIEDKTELSIPIQPDGQFLQEEIRPGIYELRLEGKGLVTIRRKIDIPKRTTLKLDALKTQLSESAILEPESVPSFQIASVGEGPAQTLWATGFAKSDYRIYRRHSSQWSEIVIPQFNGAIQVVTQKLLSNGNFVLGSVGNGAVISSDGGSTWTAVPFPVEVWGVRKVLELPDRSLLAAVMTGSRYVQDVGKIYRSADHGLSWKEVLQTQGSLSGVSKISSNRIFAHTSALDRSATIYYSDDFGSTWTESTIAVLTNPFRGINFVLELQSGKLVAGVEDGKNWKGNFSRGGILLNSIDGGRNWAVLTNNPTWTSVNGGLQASDGRLYVWSGPNVMLSRDEGATWTPFLQTGSGYVDTIVDTALGTFIIAHDKLYRIKSALDEKSLNTWLQ